MMIATIFRHGFRITLHYIPEKGMPPMPFLLVFYRVRSESDAPEAREREYEVASRRFATEKNARRAIASLAHGLRIDELEQRIRELEGRILHGWK